MRTFFVFDVKSIGLFGPAFSVGWVVIQEDGKVLTQSRHTLQISRLFGIGALKDDLAWVMRNVPLKELTITHHAEMQFAADFAAVWRYWKDKGAIMVADCPFPVEARFLNHVCQWIGSELSPYPLIDVGSVRMAVGLNPLATESRLPNELPIHDPTADARQSARLLLEALKLWPTNPLLPAASPM